MKFKSLKKADFISCEGVIIVISKKRFITIKFNKLENRLVDALVYEGGTGGIINLSLFGDLNIEVNGTKHYVPEKYIKEISFNL